MRSLVEMKEEWGPGSMASKQQNKLDEVVIQAPTERLLPSPKEPPSGEMEAAGIAAGRRERETEA